MLCVSIEYDFIRFGVFGRWWFRLLENVAINQQNLFFFLTVLFFFRMPFYIFSYSNWVGGMKKCSGKITIFVSTYVNAMLKAIV